MLGELACGVPFMNHNYGTKSINNVSKLKQCEFIFNKL